MKFSITILRIDEFKKYKNVQGLRVKCILRIDEFRKYKMLKDCMYYNVL